MKFKLEIYKDNELWDSITNEREVQRILASNLYHKYICKYSTIKRITRKQCYTHEIVKIYFDNNVTDVFTLPAHF